MPLIVKTENVRLRGKRKAKVHYCDHLKLDDGRMVARTDCGLDRDDRFEEVDPKTVDEKDFCATCEAVFVGRPG